MKRIQLSRHAMDSNSNTGTPDDNTVQTRCRSTSWQEKTLHLWCRCLLANKRWQVNPSLKVGKPVILFAKLQKKEEEDAILANRDNAFLSAVGQNNSLAYQWSVKKRQFRDWFWHKLSYDEWVTSINVEDQSKIYVVKSYTPPEECASRFNRCESYMLIHAISQINCIVSCIYY